MKMYLQKVKEAISKLKSFEIGQKTSKLMPSPG